MPKPKPTTDDGYVRTHSVPVRELADVLPEETGCEDESAEDED